MKNTYKTFVKTGLALFVILLVACTTKTSVKNKSTDAQIEAKVFYDEKVALEFVNSYIAFCNTLPSNVEYQHWVDTNKVLTKSFKKSYVLLMKKAEKEDPEMGLGYDPILNAQDFPDSGFKIKDFSKHSGIVTITSDEFSGFTLMIKLTLQNSKTMIEGSGVINNRR